MFNIFGWGKNNNNQNDDWSNENEENFYHTFRLQSEDMFKNFEMLIDGFGFEDLNRINDFLNFTFESQFDKDNQLKNGSIYSDYKIPTNNKNSLRDSMLKEPDCGNDCYVDNPHVFSSAYQFSNIFGFKSGNGIFEKKIITKGPEGIEKIIISRGVGDQFEEKTILKDSQGRIISQESTTHTTSFDNALKPSEDHNKFLGADIETTIDNVRKEYDERGSLIKQGLLSVFSSFFGQRPTSTDLSKTKQTIVDSSVDIKPIVEHPKDKKALSLYERFFGAH